MSNKFSAKDVQLLRQKTGVGMMECKSALEESNGDFDEAIKILRKKGAAKAAKKADRIAAEGIVSVKIENEEGAVVEINSETDFVAKNERFKNFVDSVLETILKNSPKNLEELNDLKISGNEEMTVKKALEEEILAIGENIKIRRFAKMEGNLISYVHGGGTIGVLVKFVDGNFKKDEKFIEFARNIAMHIAAANPKYLDSSKVPEDVLKEETEILKHQVMNSGKPENIAEKIVQGKISKFYKEVCLKDQQYVKDSSLSIKEYIKNVSKEIDPNLDILQFVRMEKGEGLEKRSDDFANEVSSMLG